MDQFKIIAPLPFLVRGEDFVGLVLGIDGHAARKQLEMAGDEAPPASDVWAVPIGDLLEAFIRARRTNEFNFWAAAWEPNCIVFIPHSCLEVVSEKQ